MHIYNNKFPVYKQIKKYYYRLQIIKIFIQNSNDYLLFCLHEIKLMFLLYSEITKLLSNLIV
jgi:hypothetical protein